MHKNTSCIFIFYYVYYKAKDRPKFWESFLQHTETLKCDLLPMILSRISLIRNIVSSLRLLLKIIWLYHWSISIRLAGSDRSFGFWTQKDCVWQATPFYWNHMSFRFISSTHYVELVSTSGYVQPALKKGPSLAMKDVSELIKISIRCVDCWFFRAWRVQCLNL